MSASRRLLRALDASARTTGCAARITLAGERPWSSATFVGTHHTITVEGGPGGTLAHWLDVLAEGSIGVPGHVVAELVIRRRADGAMLDALTLEA